MTDFWRMDSSSCRDMLGSGQIEPNNGGNVRENRTALSTLSHLTYEEADHSQMETIQTSPKTLDTPITLRGKISVDIRNIYSRFNAEQNNQHKLIFDSQKE